LITDGGAGSLWGHGLNGSEVTDPTEHIAIEPVITTITIDITAKDGITKNDYSLYVFRSIKKATFENISSPIYSLYPTYNKMTSEYSVNVPNSETEFEVLFTPETGSDYFFAPRVYTPSQMNSKALSLLFDTGYGR
jgi:hypothetical protein